MCQHLPRGFKTTDTTTAPPVHKPLHHTSNDTVLRCITRAGDDHRGSDLRFLHAENDTATETEHREFPDRLRSVCSGDAGTPKMLAAETQQECGKHIIVTRALARVSRSVMLEERPCEAGGADSES